MPRIALGLLGLVLASAAPTARATPMFMGLGAAGISRSEALDISGDGTTVVGGISFDVGGQQAFRWTAATGMMGLGTPSSFAWGVSADGSVLVGDYPATSSRDEAFRWTEATGLVGLLPGAQTSSIAHDVSADGSVVVGEGDPGVGGRQALLWTLATGVVGLGAGSSAYGISADGTVVVGFSGSPREAFRWTETTGMVGLGDLAGGDFHSIAFAVSADGSRIVGDSRRGSGRHDDEAFLWTQASGMVGLGDLEGGMLQSRAYDVNPDGSRIVGYGDGPAGREAVLWADGRIIELDQLLTRLGLDLTGWTLTEARGISDDGLIITGNGINPEGAPEAWLAVVVPEPRTSLVLAAVLWCSWAGASVARRRRQLV